MAGNGSDPLDREPRVSAGSATRATLIRAATDLFSSSQFDAVSLREIERLAGVNRGVASYHFRSKDELWRAAVDSLMQGFRDELSRHQELMPDLSRADRLRVTFKTIVRYTARHPEFFKMSVLHGADRSERTEWFARNHVEPLFSLFRDLAGTSVDYSPEDAFHFFFFAGGASLIFTVPVVCEILFGFNPTAPEFIERFANEAAGLELFPLQPLGYLDEVGGLR